MEEVCWFCFTFSLIKLQDKEKEFGLLLDNISSIKISKTVPGFRNVKKKKKHLVSVFQRWNSENFMDYIFSVFSKIIEACHLPCLDEARALTIIFSNKINPENSSLSP